MATIKLNELNSVKPAELIDLKAEAGQNTPETITAFKTLRSIGGAAGWACPKQCLQ